MGLFANPVTLNDGVGDRIFAYRSQVFDKKSIVAEYVESAAAISAESVLRVKHDPSSVAPRHLLQRQIKRYPAATPTVLGMITVNLTIVADRAFTDTEVATEVAILSDALGEANVVKSLMLNVI